MKEEAIEWIVAQISWESINLRITCIYTCKACQ